MPGTRSRSLVLMIGLSLCLWWAVVPSWAGTPADSPGALEKLPDGEFLRYRLLIWKGLEVLGLEVGTGTFHLERRMLKGQEEFFAIAVGRGGALGYFVQTTIRSRFRVTDLTPLGYEYRQTGTDPKVYALDFSEGRVVYRKLKHCNVAGCEESEHQLTREERAWFIGPKRTVTEHCDDHDECANRCHYFWLQRDDQEVEPATYDMLCAVYVARTLGLQPGGEAHDIRVTNRHDVWDVKITPHQVERVEVPEGVHDALLVTLEPRPVAGKEVREEFRGLFGLHGGLKIWLDSASGIPVKIQGVIPFGVDLNAQIELVSQKRS